MPQVSLPAFVAKALAGDSLLSFPTDTVPALAIRPDRADRLFVAKQRQLDKPLILLGASIADLWPYIMGTPAEFDIWQQVAQQYWPGALTLVLPASDRVPAVMNPQQRDTIGVRVPNHAIAQAILAQTGPLATTSANRSGEPALQTMTAIEAAFPDVVTLLPDTLQALDATYVAEPSLAQWGSGVPSTVIRWTTAGWDVLRQGSVKIDGLPWP